MQRRHDLHEGHAPNNTPTIGMTTLLGRAGTRASPQRHTLSLLQELFSMCARSSAIEPKRTVPWGSWASMEPSA